MVRSSSFAAAPYHSERKEDDRIWEYYASAEKRAGTMGFDSEGTRWERRFLAMTSHIFLLHSPALHPL